MAGSSMLLKTSERRLPLPGVMTVPYSLLYCCQTNKPALSITVQTCELFVPTEKHLQTNLHLRFKTVYIFSLALPKFPLLT